MAIKRYTIRIAGDKSKGIPLMKHCKLCDEDVPSLDEKIEDLVLDMIKRSNPDWVEADGACEKCISYYEKLPQFVEVDEKK